MARIISGMTHRGRVAGLTLAAVLAVSSSATMAEQLPWQKKAAGQYQQDCGQGGYGTECDDPNGNNQYAPEPAYAAPAYAEPGYAEPAYAPPPYKPRKKPAYAAPKYKKGPYKPQYQQPQYGQADAPYAQDYDPSLAVLPDAPDGGYGQPQYGAEPPYQPPPRATQRQDTFSPDEISGAGHRFFGNVTKGLASVIEYAFQQQGRPNGYILGEEGGGAFVAGLRYGEGVLHTKNAGRHRVYWQGPSIGYDFGAEGSKAMILVYDMYSPEEIFYDYAGVGGQAYLVGGVGITFLKSGHVTMAPIRSGLGLRLGANVGYLKFTRSPTWNPF